MLAPNLFNRREASCAGNDRVGVRLHGLFQQLPIAGLPDLPPGSFAGIIRHRDMREGLLLLPPIDGAARKRRRLR